MAASDRSKAASRWTLRAFTAVIVLTLCATAATSNTTGGVPGPYSVTDLGTLGGHSKYCLTPLGPSTYATAINSAHDVAGWSCKFVNAFDSVIHSFLYRDGMMTDIGTIGPANDIAIAHGINDAGEVVGASGVMEAAPDVGGRAFLYDGEDLIDLGGYFDGFSQATDINNAHHIVGYASSGRIDIWSAFLLSDGVLIDLGTLGGTFRSAAMAINDLDQIVGYASTAGNTSFHAFLHSAGVMNDLGTLGGTNSYAAAVNNVGVVVGRSQTPFDTETHAFVYASGSMTDLGTLGGLHSVALGINDAGGIVGYALTETGAYHAFLYQDGKMHDLNALIGETPGLTLTYAKAINEDGSIAASGKIGGEDRAFVLRPAETNHPPDCSGAIAGPGEIWPPGHELVAVGIAGVTDPDGDPVTITVTGVTQDEPVLSRGEGNTCPDALIDDDGLLLRAERSGQGNGRVYVVSFTADDGNGGSCDGTVRVCVPHDQGLEPTVVAGRGPIVASRGCGPDDDPQSYNSLGPCPARKRGVTTEPVAVLSLSLEGGSLRGNRATVAYTLPQDTEVTLAVYDISGRRAAMVEKGPRTAGAHQASWDASALSPGIYFYRLRAGGEVALKSVLVLR